MEEINKYERAAYCHTEFERSRCYHPQQFSSLSPVFSLKFLRLFCFFFLAIIRFKMLLIVLTVCSLSTKVMGMNECPNNVFSHNPSLDECFYVSKVATSFYEADKFCKLHGKYAAHVTLITVSASFYVIHETASNYSGHFNEHIVHGYVRVERQN